jgi:hypothetical protein
MTNPLPRPTTLDADTLLDVLSLRQNAKLRRELGTHLGQLAAQRWPSSKEQDIADWGAALLDLLARPEGPVTFRQAAERQNGGALDDDDRLNLARAAHRYAIREARKSGNRAERANPAATVQALVASGAVGAAALLAWAVALCDPDERQTIFDTVQESQELSAAFGLDHAPDGVDVLLRLRAAAAEVAAAERPEITALEALATLATQVATVLRLSEAQDAKARALLVERLANSRLGLASVQLPDGAPLADITAALDVAESAEDALKAATAEYDAAHMKRGSGHYDTLRNLLRLEEDANAQAVATRDALMRLLLAESSTEPAPNIEPEPSIPPHPAGPVAKGDLPTAAPPEPLRAPIIGTMSVAVQPDPAPAPPPMPADPPSIPTVSVDVPPEPPPPPATPRVQAAPVVGALQEVLPPPPAEPTAPAVPPTPTGTHVASADGVEEAVLLHALASKRLGLAQALLDAGSVPGHAALLSPAIRLAATALVADDSADPGDVSSLVDAFLDAWPPHAGSTMSTTAWLLAMPAAGLLTVLAPGGNTVNLVDELLRAPPERIPHTLALARTISEYSAQLAVLSQTSDALLSAAGEDMRRQQLMAQGEQIRGWLDRNREPQLNNYAPARILWSRMIQPDEALGVMLAAACANAADRASAVAEGLAHFDGRKEMERLDVALRGARLVQKTPISHGARRDIANLLEEAERHLHEWVRVAKQAATPEQRGLAHSLRDLLLPQLQSAAEEIGALPHEAAAAAAGGVIRRFVDLFAQGTWPAGRGSIDQHLACDVVQVLGIALDPSWRMSVPRSEDMRRRIIAAVDTPIPLDVAIRRRISAGEMGEAVLALRLLEDADVRADLDREVRDAAGARHQATSRMLAEARTQVEAAEGDGRLPYGRAQQFLLGIDDLETMLRLATPEDVPPIEREFAKLHNEIGDELARAAAQQRARILQRLSGLNLTVQGAIRSEVIGALDRGWLANAEDLIDRAESGEHTETGIEPDDVTRGFTKFFPSQAESIARALRTNRAAILAFAEQSSALPDELAIPPGLREPGQRLARAWLACAAGKSPGSSFATLFEELGFVGARTEAINAMPIGGTRLTLSTQPLRDRDTTLLPDFGSLADGSYPVLALVRQPEVQQIRIALQQMGGSARAAIVLFFGVLSNPDRRELVRMAALGQIGTAIVIDHVLLVHLAMQEGNRLRVLFECTLPFSGVTPWSAIGAPAPEMFFGRHNERQEIEARNGQLSHLAYGGRQLGKTALLRQIEGAAAGDARRVVRYIDVKPFGTSRPTADIWSTLAEALRPAVPLTADGRGEAGARFAREVTSWLDGHADRSILLLLDEADKFFKEDQANGYRVTEQLRALAEQTRRRFKPVFAGLENVQRMARDPNNPIAQLGIPLLIGPLLRGAERRAAATLVRWPFAALGYSLAQPVVNRILVFANYYPSLIQLVCQSLLQELRARQGGAPPWQVEMADVENLLARPDMRQSAFDKFRITLDLDPRYYLLALAVAERNQEEALTLSTGVAAGRLREHAAAFWPEGFAGLDEEAFDALLDQMVGLGVLRAAGNRRFALRSANLIHLIGSPKTIDDQLLSFVDRPAPDEPDPLENRRTIDDVPSVLTTRQEATILGPNMGDGVVICLGLGVGGTLAGDGSRVDKAIRQAALALPQARRPALPALKAKNAAEFRQELTALAARGGEQGLLAIATPAHGWTSEWVCIAVTILQARRSGGPALRIALIGDAEQSWKWTEATPSRAALLSDGSDERRLVSEIVPGLWNRPSIDVWMMLHDQTGLLPDWLVNDRGTLLRGTGGWNWALRRLAAIARPGLPRMDATQLATRLLDKAENDAALRELGNLPGVLALLEAVELTQSLRGPGDNVTSELVADLTGQPMPLAGLAWAQAVEAVVPGEHGLELNPLLRAALPLLRASAR